MKIKNFFALAPIQHVALSCSVFFYVLRIFLLQTLQFFVYWLRIAIILFCAIFLVFCIFLLYKKFMRKKNYQNVKRTFFALCAGIAFASIALIALCKTSAVVTLAPKQDIVAIKGTLAKDPVPSAKGDYLLTLKLSSAKTDSAFFSCMGTCTVFAPKELIEASYPGRVFSFSKSVRNANNVQRANNLPSANLHNANYFEAGAVVLCEGNFAQNQNDGNFFYAKNVEQKSFTSKLFAIRANLRIMLKRILFAFGDAGSLLLALVSGTREYVASDVLLAYRLAGLSHVLALSGMHVSVLGGLVGGIAKKIAGQKCSIFATTIFCWLFVFFAGSSPSLVRAALFVTVQSVCSLLGVSVCSISVFCMAFVLQLVFMPSGALDAGFLLSYSAVLGILVFAKPLLRLCVKAKTKIYKFAKNLLCAKFLLKRQNNLQNALSLKSAQDKSTKNAPSKTILLSKLRLPSKIILLSKLHARCKKLAHNVWHYTQESFAVSLGAFLMTLPFSLILFGTITYISVISSVAVVPVISLFFILGLFAIILCALCPAFLGFASFALGAIYALLDVLVRFFSAVSPIYFGG